MQTDDKLYRALYRLRDRLKEQGRRKDGRAPVVCTDEALLALARLRPEREADLAAVPGLGKRFAEQYGAAFLSEIQRFEQARAPEQKAVRLSGDAVNTLKEMEKKLVSINRRNRLLYLPKAPARYAADLYGTPAGDGLDALLFSGKTLLCAEAGDSAGGAALYKKLTQLLREVNRDLRDKGKNDLFLAYPFAEGRLPGERFDVRAPLALFPISAERDAQRVRIRLDSSRDPVYNTTLLLAHMKFSGGNKPLPGALIEEPAAESFLPALLRFYADAGLILTDGGEAPGAFTEYRADEFPSYRPGELLLKRNIVLGRFPTYSSFIQIDFERMIEARAVNPLVSELLASPEEIDLYAESEPLPQTDAAEIDERALTYINELNGSQERVLALSNKLDALVVQGPPGTGKSQAITSLIAQFASAGKTVLMVSEKKTALDVVYARLGTLSRYALLIDDTGNKDLFYAQLDTLLRAGTPPAGGNAESASAAIENGLHELDELSALLSAKDESGTAPYELYLASSRIDLSRTEALKRFRAFREAGSDALVDAPYPELAALHEQLCDADARERVLRCCALNKAYPWLKAMRADLGEYELVLLDEKLGALIQSRTAWEKKPGVIRLLKKGALKREALAILNAYFNEPGGKRAKSMLKNAEAMRISLSSYTAFVSDTPLYAALSDAGRTYAAVLQAAHSAGMGEPEALNGELFNQLVCERIQRFEAQHRAVLQRIDHFDTLVRALAARIAEKSALGRANLERSLYEGAAELLASKRRGEMLRVIESKRRWSVNKFIGKFSFELFRGVRIWMMTPEAVSELLPLTSGLFDLAVFDEASQMYPERGVPAILRAKKTVIAGDQKQLRPSSLGSGRMEADEDASAEDEELPAALEEESLLDLARFRYNDGRDVLLNFHYRSRYEELIAFSNSAFYHGRLYVSPNCEKPARPPIEVIRVENAVWEKRQNRAEAEAVVAALKRILAEREHNETVGVITFNIAQRELIDDLLDAACAADAAFAELVLAETARRENGEDVGLFIKNIESVQGDERDIILFSVGYARNAAGKLISRFGWLNQRGGENRLNVAITRAKRKIYLALSFDPETLSVDDTLNEGPRILKKYLQYAEAVSAGSKELTEAVLASFGTEEAGGERARAGVLAGRAAEALEARGYEVEKQAGIGGYRLDLAVKKDGRYVLGVECDGKLYESGLPARERDYHRQKYLETRGWRVYRLFGTAWWKDPEAETERIVRAIEARA